MDITKVIKLFGVAVTRTPRVAQFAITNRCNGRCKVCSIWKQKTKVSVSKEDGFAVIDRLAKMGVFQVTFTGGEPMLNIHLYDFIERARKNNIAASICVGDPRLITEESAKRMHDSGTSLVSLSMDTDNSQLGTDVRGITDIIPNFVRIINLMKKYSIMLVAAPTITEYTWDRVPEILESAKNLGFEYININYPTKSLSKTFQIGGEGTSFISLTSEQTIYSMKAILNHIEDSNEPFILNPSESIENMIKFLQDPETVDYHCLGGWQVFAIDWFCDVYPCWRSNEKLGNMLDPAFKLKKRKHNACTMSWFRDFSVVFQDRGKIAFNYLRSGKFDRIKATL